MTELFHRGYNPRTLPPEFTTWFDFVAAEDDAPALEAECLGRFRDYCVKITLRPRPASRSSAHVKNDRPMIAECGPGWIVTDAIPCRR